MATLNPFGLLGDDDAEDPTQLLAAQKVVVAAPAQPPAKKHPVQTQSAPKMPSKPLPPAQAVSESRGEGQQGGRGSGRGGVRGRGRGGQGFNRDSADNENTFGSTNGFSGGYRPSDDGDARKAPSERRPYGGPRAGGGFRGGRRGGFDNEENTEGERPRRDFDRRSGTGRGNEFKREGSGRGNWGTPTDEIVSETEEPVKEEEKTVDSETQSGPKDTGDANTESAENEQKKDKENEPEPEEKVMTLEEYEKVLEDKRKALAALKTEERKVYLDKELESMQLLSNKKNDDEVFIKLGSDKDKCKEAAEKAKKSVSINEFLKPTEGENYYRGGGRGRGRGRGRGGFAGTNYNAQAPAIEDVGEFPSLGAK